MRTAVGALVIGFVLACAGSGSQTEEEAWDRACNAAAACDPCGADTEPGYIDAVVDHALPDVHVDTVRDQLSAMKGLGVDRQLAAWKAARKGEMSDCALTSVLEERLERAVALELPKACSVHTTCESFDGTDPATVLDCIEQSTESFLYDEIARMDTRSSVGLAKSLEAYAAKHSGAACPLSIVLRDAR